jgi:hypothetical protein
MCLEFEILAFSDIIVLDIIGLGLCLDCIFTNEMQIEVRHVLRKRTSQCWDKTNWKTVRSKDPQVAENRNTRELYTSLFSSVLTDSATHF